MDTNWIVALTITWLIGWCPVNGKATCREVQLARDCEALCKKTRNGTISCELRVAVLLPADPTFDIALPKVLPVLGKFPPSSEIVVAFCATLAAKCFRGRYFKTNGKCIGTVLKVCSLPVTFTDLAIYEARSRGLLPHWLKLKFLSQDDHCDATYAQIGAIDSFSNCVHLFLGPACDYCVGK